MNKQRRTNYVRAIEEQVKKFTLQPGDVIVFRGNENAGRELFESLKEGLAGVLPKDVLFIALKVNEASLDKLSPKEMAKYGWYRKDSE